VSLYGYGYGYGYRSGFRLQQASGMGLLQALGFRDGLILVAVRLQLQGFYQGWAYFTKFT
jgi:hypothetical protein